jgi:hypothetical protein
MACGGCQQPTWILAYSLGNSWRRLTLPKRIESWSANSSQQGLIKAGGRLVKQPRFIWPFLGVGHLNRQ